MSLRIGFPLLEDEPLVELDVLVVLEELELELPCSEAKAD
jgi:hypothetical protein